MKKDLQKHLTKIVYTGHKHPDITAWIQCAVCGPKYLEWKQERDRLKARFPKDFERYEQKWLPGPELLETLERMRWELKQRGADPRLGLKAKELQDKIQNVQQSRSTN